jgi:RNA polymerase sigma-70 factor (ECF subfamily)
MFEWMYQKYAPALRLFCASRLNDVTEAEDACHESLLRARGAMGSFRRDARLWPWLVTIASNVCRDVNRKRRQAVSTEPEEVADSSACPHEDFAKTIRAEILSEAMKALPGRYREHVQLKDFNGWSYQEMADFYGSSVGAVRSTLLRARRALKERVVLVAKARSHWPLPSFAPFGLSYLVRAWRSSINSIRCRAASWSAPDPGLVFSVSQLVMGVLVVGVVIAPNGVSSAPSSSSAHLDSSWSSTVQSSQVTTIIDASDVSAQADVVDAQPAKKVATPKISLSVDQDGDGEPDHDVLVLSPLGVDCGEPEKRGIVLRTACPLLP